MSREGRWLQLQQQRDRALFRHRFDRLPAIDEELRELTTGLTDTYGSLRRWIDRELTKEVREYGNIRPEEEGEGRSHDAPAI